MSLNLPNAELQRMVEKMATEIKSLKGELVLEQELVGALESDLRKLTWALQIAKDEAKVNADLLAKATKRASLKVVNTEVPVYFLPFATDEADELTQVRGSK